jgi:hypothetical protein
MLHWYYLSKWFANRSIGSIKYYADNRNANEKKAWWDCCLGKLGEFVARDFLCKHDTSLPKSVEPDINIYEPWEKSWAPDLDFPTVSVDVKSCLNPDFPPSVTFQWGNNNGVGGRDQFFLDSRKSNKQEVVCLVHIDTRQLRGCRVHSIVPRHEALPLFDDPVLEYLKGIKKCLYFSDVEKACQSPFPTT